MPWKADTGEAGHSHGSARLATAIAAVLVAPLTTNAGSTTWNNLGSEWVCVNNTNWNGSYPGIMGATSSEVATFPQADTVVTPNIGADLALGGIVINNGNADYSITQSGGNRRLQFNSSNALTISGGGVTTIAPEVHVTSGTRTFDTGSTLTTFAGGFVFDGSTTVSLANSVPLLVQNYINTSSSSVQALTLSGTGSMTVQGSVRAVTGATQLVSANTFSGTLRLESANTLSSFVLWAAGTLDIASNNALNTSGGTAELRMGYSLSTSLASTVLASGPYTISNKITFVSNCATPGITLGSTGAGAVFSGAIELTNMGSNCGGLKLTAAEGASVTFSGNINGINASNHYITKIGAGLVKLTGGNGYMGKTVVSSGTLQFGRQESLYWHTLEQWTDSNVIVEAGATAAFNVGGSSEFTAADISLLASLGSASGGFRNGSAIALDTTNAAGNSFSLAGLANPNGGSNALGLTKLGSNSLVLTGASSYTGPTLVQEGTLQVDGTLNAASAVTVLRGVLQGRGDGITSGRIGGSVTIGDGTLSAGARDATLAPGDSIGALKVGSTTFQPDGLLLIEISDSGAEAGLVDRLNVMGDLLISSGAAVDFTTSGTLNDTAYIFATYTGVRTGEFTALNLPENYSVVYDYGGTGNIALVTPEPVGLAVLALGAVTTLGRPRRHAPANQRRAGI